MEEQEMISLASLKDGAAIERFDDALGKVLENILDPNTPATAVREIALKVKFRPTENRDFTRAEIHCEVKLAGASPVMTQIYVGKDLGGVTASEINANQFGLFPPKKARSQGSTIPTISEGFEKGGDV